MNSQIPQTRHLEVTTVKGTKYRLEVCFSNDGGEIIQGFWDRYSGGLKVNLQEAVYLSKKTLIQLNEECCRYEHNGRLNREARVELLRKYGKLNKELLERLVQGEIIEPESRLAYIDPVSEGLVVSSPFDLEKGVKDLDKIGYAERQF